MCRFAFGLIFFLSLDRPIFPSIMSVFPDWPKYATHQKRLRTGCIPTAYEMLLRAAGTSGIDFTTFQDDFDLDQHGGAPCNNFETVAEAIEKKYPQAKFSTESFAKGEGHKKLARGQEYLAAKKPVIVSLSNVPFGGPGWHIMVVVDESPTDLTLLQYVDKHGRLSTLNLPKALFATIHDNFEGGDQIAFLKSDKL